MASLTFTYNNNTASPIFANFGFTIGGSTEKTATFTVGGGAPVTGVDLNSPSATSIGAGVTTTITISAVAGSGTLTAFIINGGEDILTQVTTAGDTSFEWALGPDLTSFAQTFLACQKLTLVPVYIPFSVTNLSGMFENADLFNQASISNWNTSNVTNMSSMFANTDGASAFNQDISPWNVRKVTNFSSMFLSATAFNNGGVPLDWADIGADISVTTINMSNMFFNATLFNQVISEWNTFKVTNMASMFASATAFNQDISFWNVTAVTNMTSMFSGAIAFAQPIQYWITGSVALNNIILNATAFQAAYSAVPNYVYPTLPPAYFGITRPERFPCFMKGTQILCYRADAEVYRPVQDLRKGDLVKTLRNGYLPIHMIGTSSLSNPGDDERSTNRLYKCSKELYPGLFEDLYITGCHSILVPSLTEDQWENTKEMLGDVYVTDNHFRLMACLDEKAQPFKKDAYIDIYHIALENEDYYMNYGVYANGLLVETCSKRYLTELSNMRILGEEEACCKAPVNVFNMMGGSVQIC